MKKKLIFLCLLLFIAYILTAPKDAVNAASVGLVLWYTRVLPTLLPFVILSNILMDSNYLQYLNKITAPLVSRLIPVSDNGAFVLLSGFLFGFPIGSKNCAALLASGKITRREADVLFIITNNISPVFVTSFILYTQLKLSHLSAVTLLILYFPALLLGSILLSTDARRTKDRTAFHAQKQPASGSQMNLEKVTASSIPTNSANSASNCTCISNVPFKKREPEQPVPYFSNALMPASITRSFVVSPR